MRSTGLMGRAVPDLAGCGVMVAGGAGFVGSAIVRELLREGSIVVCYDNYLHGHPAHVAGLAGPLTVIHGDVRDDWSLFKALRDHHVEYIIDCVGDTFVPTAYTMPRTVLRHKRRRHSSSPSGRCRRCRSSAFVYVSSTEVYGDTSCIKCNEETRLNPVNTYAVSKAAADRLCHTYYLEHGVPVVIARIFNCYGPRETEPYVIPEIIAQLYRSPRIALGNIKAERDFTFVHDTAKALISVLTSDVPNGEVVNVGSDTSYSVEWLAHKLAKIMEVKSLQIVARSRKISAKGY